MSETYHGAEIPEDIWESWNDRNSSEVSGFCRGVRAAVRPDTITADLEMTRLGSLARARDEAAQVAWETQYAKDMAAYKARKEQA